MAQKNVGDFSKNVGVFSENVGDFSKNVGRFPRNVGVFFRRIGDDNSSASKLLSTSGIIHCQKGFRAPSSRVRVYYSDFALFAFTTFTDFFVTTYPSGNKEHVSDIF